MKIGIVGAGITGLYLAWQLSKKGHQVTVFEKKRGVGKEACSGLFSERILKFIPETRKLIENEIKSVLIHFPKKTIKVRFSKTFFVISHAELDRQVYDLAKKSGAEIVLNKEIKVLPQDFDRIIGCDGAGSFVRKALGLKDTNCRLGILGFTEAKNTSFSVETWPVKNGFIWKIPRRQKTEYGIIADTTRAQKLLEGFLKKNEVKLKNIKSALIPQEFSSYRRQSVTLCGDAAGLTKPWSGGGVIWGLKACDVLLKNFPDFLKYDRALKRYFLPKIIIAKTAVKVVYFLGFKTPWALPKNVKMESDFLL